MEILQTTQNPLGTKKINKLIFQYSLPSVIGMLVNALYNIVDQIFIGHGIGILGTATTNIAFPITTICTAISMLIGIGGSTNLNLYLGQNERENANGVIGTAISLMLISGISFTIILLFFLNPILRLFGITEQLLNYGTTYVRIIALGIPFLIVSSAGSQIIRADGSPFFSMVSMITGALLNIILDPLFIFVFNLGIAGAAWATIISQIISCILVLGYMRNFKSIKLKLYHLKIKKRYFINIVKLGAGASINQFCITIFQIVLNNSLVFYGTQSIYGSEIPLACVGVISKINTLLIALISGTSQGCQPIFSFNYGAKKYDRLLETIKKAMIIIIEISIIAEFIFQLFPTTIVSIFGTGSSEYYQFSEKYLRIFMLMTFINGIQPLVGNFLSSIGKAVKGIFAILLRQFLLLIPAIIIFPIFWGIDGIVYAGPIADLITAIIMLLLLKAEISKIKKKVRI